ncbi:hypothetical protein KL942_005303 [Ogataea angusta]|uniref:NADP-dependent oxidoreductase domain-containing protein n=1 Tax=Pichia angusta TaxID=870730 RepID=A0AAN6DAY3_PICAN|nr:uncharacterized protein KL928_005132 [Ogataea angusta]KAG7816166.1 hypothetical protein KL928_005132 [Ogataea angusta]KAG7830068.1 hypothetical protein KL943_005234 [Ogataea angusta]KAG7835480.1 hypothetical protein KL942_005303 [Ogataea angusta]KAG7842736.1 hypothetical protein KL941_004766 [Ogataea angusta]KAG7845532.1 hypothetical protein KL940_005218 [Ogataea angusta]
MPPKFNSFKWDTIPQELYTRLGKSGLQISRIVLGCMSYGRKSWFDYVLEDEDEVFEIMKKAYDSGIRTFDTSCNYSNGYSEILVGKFLKKYNIDRRTVVILSKCFFPPNESDPDTNILIPGTAEGSEYINRIGLSRTNILDSVDKSIERLGTHIDLLQVHRFDVNTPIEETMEALHDVVKSGKAKYIGASMMRTYQFVEMQNVAEKHGWTKFISMQSYYSLFYREEEDEMIAYCKKTGVGLIPFSTLAAGVLARPYDKMFNTTTRSSAAFSARMFRLNEVTDKDKLLLSRVEELANKHGVKMATVAIAWCLAKDHNPILGLNKVERVDDALAALKLKLTDDEIAYLEEPDVSRKLPNLYR